MINETIDVILVSLSFIAFIYPVAYIFYKKGNCKFLFISSVLGAVIVTNILLVLMVTPIIIFVIYFLPSLDHLGYTENIYYLLVFFEFVDEYYFSVATWINAWLSFLLYRKYELFNSHT